MKEKIYLDHNATTPLDPRVLEVMIEELKAGPSNPSSVHEFGRQAHLRLARSREKIASFLNVSPQELIFTASGTEAINIILLGMHLKGHIITSNIEHAAIYNTIKHLEKQGCTVSYLPIGSWGAVNLIDVEKSIQPNTCLIALGAVNSETGVKNPFFEIAKIAESRNVPFVVDAVAWLGKELFTIPNGVHAMAFSGHKIHGPKGIGLAWVKKNLKLDPLFFGGGQEFSRRAGTENLSGIIGLAKAIEILEETLPEATEKMLHLRNLFEERLKEHIPDLHINGEGPRICNTSSITFPDIDGEALLVQLDRKGIAASMGSACSSGALEPSRVLLNMGLSTQQALSTMRFSFSRFTTEEEILQAIAIISKAVSLQKKALAIG